MSGYLLPLTCPNCGKECVHVASGSSTGAEAHAVVRCCKCTREWQVVAYIRPLHAPDMDLGSARQRHQVAPCGSDAGYYRHLRITETPPCEACRRAHADAGARRKRKSRAAS